MAPVRRAATPLPALVAVTAIWGYTFVPVQKAVGVYPLFAFLAVRFAISTAALAPFAWRSLRTLPRGGVAGRPRGRQLPRARLRPPDGGPRADDGHEHGLHHRPLRRLHAASRARRLPDTGAGARLGRCRACARRPAAPERRAGRLVARERARARERGRPVAPDRRDGAVCAALRRAGAHLPADGRRGRGIHGHRRRGGPARGAAGRRDVVRAGRDGRVRRARSATSSGHGCSPGRPPPAQRSCSPSRRRSPRSSACSSSRSTWAGQGGPDAP